MRKAIISLLISILLCFSFQVKAVDYEDINDYVSGNPIYKWYDGNSYWSNNLISPKAIKVSDELVEGVDYIREYAFTRDRRVNDDELTEWKTTSEGMSNSGYIWERVTGIGKYSNSYAVRNEIYTAIFVYVLDATKVKGDEDPEFEYKVVMHNENTNNITDMFDISFEREEGEDIGTYKVTPVIKKKDSISDSQLITLGSMAIGDYTNGRVYFYPRSGKLTIKEKENVTVPVSNEDIPNAPDTGI